MRIGVMSDTHGRLDLMEKAAARMRDEFGVQAIIHLGDDYADAMELGLKDAELIAVPGMYEAAWHDRKIPHRLVKKLGGVTFLISHTPTKDSHDLPGDIDPGLARQKYGARVLLHGHTHRRRAVEAEDGLIIVNPGHLKSSVDRSLPPTFAVIAVEAPMLDVQIVELDGGVIEQRQFEVGG